MKPLKLIDSGKYKTSGMPLLETPATYEPIMSEPTAEMVGGPCDGETIIDEGHWKLEEVDKETNTVHVYQRVRAGRYEYRGAQKLSA